MKTIKRIIYTFLSPVTHIKANKSWIDGIVKEEIPYRSSLWCPLCFFTSMYKKYILRENIKIMTEGTISYLFGCHQFLIHPILVVIAWKKHFGTMPRLWELICILLHDIGHVGLDYLSNYEEKQTHWIRGTLIADKLFGEKGFLLVAGHTTQSNWSRSKLFWADKYSRVIAPMWWLRLNEKIEEFGDRSLESWRKMIIENWEKNCPKGDHQIYLELKGK